MLRQPWLQLSLMCGQISTAFSVRSASLGSYTADLLVWPCMMHMKYLACSTTRGWSFTSIGIKCYGVHHLLLGVLANIVAVDVAWKSSTAEHVDHIVGQPTELIRHLLGTHA